MTKSKRYVLRFDMADFDGVAVYAEYDVFIVEDESLEYTLTIGCYHGTAGTNMLIITHGIKEYYFIFINVTKIDE